MNPDRHSTSHWDFYQDLVQGRPGRRRQSHRAVLRRIQRRARHAGASTTSTPSASCSRSILLPRGLWDVAGERVRSVGDPRYARCSPSRASSTTSPARARPAPRTSCAPASPRRTQQHLTARGRRPLRHLQRPPLARPGLSAGARVHRRARGQAGRCSRAASVVRTQGGGCAASLPRRRRPRQSTRSSRRRKPSRPGRLRAAKKVVAAKPWRRSLRRSRHRRSADAGLMQPVGGHPSRSESRDKSASKRKNARQCGRFPCAAPWLRPPRRAPAGTWPACRACGRSAAPGAGWRTPAAGPPAPATATPRARSDRTSRCDRVCT